MSDRADKLAQEMALSVRTVVSGDLLYIEDVEIALRPHISALEEEEQERLQESILRARDLRDEEWNGAFHQLRLALNEAGYGGPLTTDAIASIAREIPQMVKLQEQIQAQEKLIRQLRTDIGAHLQEIDRLSSRYSRSNTSRNPGDSQ